MQFLKNRFNYLFNSTKGLILVAIAMIGIVAALLILFIMFRSVYAMALPLGVAILGLLTGLSIVGLLGMLIDIPSVAPRLGTMIGLGVGIDYALFILSRHRDNIEEGMDHTESIARTKQLWWREAPSWWPSSACRWPVSHLYPRSATRRHSWSPSRSWWR